MPCEVALSKYQPLMQLAWGAVSILHQFFKAMAVGTRPSRYRPGGEGGREVISDEEEQCTVSQGASI